MTLPNDLIDELLLNYKNPEDLIVENGLLKQLTKAVIEGALQAEMGVHLGHSKYERLAMRQVTRAMAAAERP